tara:strand:- start:9965 stop:11464 length:1500 start_codon:yes stop_codon:yes gene_type:complete
MYHNIVNIKLFLFLILTLPIIHCSSDLTVDANNEFDKNFDTDDLAVNLEGDLQISDFVWKGLNEFYYWQDQVSELSDEKLIDEKEYADYIKNNSNPNLFFESLKHSDDRFSWIQDNYVELENNLQGVFATNGVEFGLLYACENCNEVLGFVKYIYKGSNADGKNINRGDFFNGVNGTILNDSNYIPLLFGENLNYTLNMATIENGKVIPNGVNVELTKEENFETNPIQINKTFDIQNGDQVGYLMYNQFVANKSVNLNDVFAEFKNKNIDNLIVDLRYNGGGSVKNCVELASMITGQFESGVFAQEQWNSKLISYLEKRFGSESLINRFVDTLSNGSIINSLKLDRVYVITSSESASASELLINGLSSYIEVIQIGERTVGKNVGSITVYDYIDNEKTKNPDHNYAMQPIVLKMANSDGYADYTEGLQPDRFIEEDITNLGELGNVGEPLLKSTLNLISGTKKVISTKPKLNKEFLIIDPLMLERQKMIIEKNINYLIR